MLNISSYARDVTPETSWKETSWEAGQNFAMRSKPGSMAAVVTSRTSNPGTTLGWPFAIQENDHLL